LEGLFQNPTHQKHFLSLSGFGKLTNLLELPTLPYDFASSPYFHSLTHCIHTLLETDPSLCVTPLHLILLDTFHTFTHPSVETDSPTATTMQDLCLYTNSLGRCDEMYTALVRSSVLIKVLVDSLSTASTKSIQVVLGIFSKASVMTALGEMFIAVLKHLHTLDRAYPELVGEGYTMRNAKHVRALLVQIVKQTRVLLVNVLKILTNRRVVEGQRKHAKEITEQIAEMFRVCLMTQGDQEERVVFVGQVLTSLYSVLTDGKPLTILTN
jgi:hypothetical protein